MKTHERKLKTVKEMLDILAKKLTAQEYITMVTFLESMYMGFDFGYKSVQELDKHAIESFLKQEKNMSFPWPIPFKMFYDFGRIDYEVDDEGFLVRTENKEKAPILPFPGGKDC
jgi:hypothetical protein